MAKSENINVAMSMAESDYNGSQLALACWQ
jgi:hypothetical protein